VARESQEVNRAGNVASDCINTRPAGRVDEDARPNDVGTGQQDELEVELVFSSLCLELLTEPSPFCFRAVKDPKPVGGTITVPQLNSLGSWQGQGIFLFHCLDIDSAVVKRKNDGSYDVEVSTSVDVCIVEKILMALVRRVEGSREKHDMVNTVRAQTRGVLGRPRVERSEVLVWRPAAIIEDGLDIGAELSIRAALRHGACLGLA
jgi:hypothetical protein